MRRDKQATEAAHFKDPRSYVGQWLHPNTSHPCVYLKGEDVCIIRAQVYERAHGHCYYCKRWIDVSWFEMHHLKGGLGRQRCWCFENLVVSCNWCHRNKHVRPMWKGTDATINL